MNGQRFGRLEVIRAEKYNSGVRCWCRCDCGTEFSIIAHKLKTGHTKSCGCLRVDVARHNGLAQKRHGHTSGPIRSRTWMSWSKMRERVLNPNHVNHRHYADVSIDSRWDSFESFLEDMGERPEGTSLDRIDPYGNYEPGNCRWATPLEQRHNRRVTA